MTIVRSPLVLTAQQEEAIEKISLREQIHTVVPHLAGTAAAYSDDDVAYIGRAGTVVWESTIR